MTLTLSPQTKLGRNDGLSLPRKTVATCVAKRPKTTPDASNSRVACFTGAVTLAEIAVSAVLTNLFSGFSAGFFGCAGFTDGFFG